MIIAAPRLRIPPAWVVAFLASYATAVVAPPWWAAFLPAVALALFSLLFGCAEAYAEGRKARARQTDDGGEDDAFWTKVCQNMADWKRKFL